MRHSRRSRSGFTILEVILASSIALLLMAALYTAMNTSLGRTDDGRTLVEQTTIIRSVLQRITADISPTLTPVNAKTEADAAAPSATAATDTTDPATTTDEGTDMATMSQLVGQNLPFQTGIIGDSTTLTIYLSRVPDLSNADVSTSENSVTTSDLRRITYWLAASEGGLARQELFFLTAESALASTMPNIENEASLVIAPEIKSIQFDYWDGTSWSGSWNGSQPGLDGLTPIGPPRAIAITMEMELPRFSGTSAENRPLKKVRHVIAIPAAAGPGLPGALGLEAGATP